MTTQRFNTHTALGFFVVWVHLTSRDWRFWAFVALGLVAVQLNPDTVDVISLFLDGYALALLLVLLPLCLQQTALLQAARAMGGTGLLWAFLTAGVIVAGGLLPLTVAGPWPFPQSFLDGLRWWAMVLVVAGLPVSNLLRSLLLATMAWFGSTCATYSPLGVWIDIWPRADRTSMVSLFLAASWLALAACLALRKAPHEVRHSR